MPDSQVSPQRPFDHDLLGKNVRAIVDLEREAHGGFSWAERLGVAISRYAGSMRFILFHVLWFASWIALNAGAIPGVRPFDPYPFTFLTFCVSLEAIFLSSFLLISQNRLSRISDERAHLDLQINLIAEQENTQALVMLQDLCRHLNVPTSTPDKTVNELTQETQPSHVASTIKREMNA